MNSVSGLKQLLIGKGIPNAESVNSFSKLKELVNLAHSNRVPKEEEYQNGPRRAIKKVYCGTNSLSGYETSSTRAGLNGMTYFVKNLPDLKSVNKVEHPTELACVGLMIPFGDCTTRTACNCNGVTSCNCHVHETCKCKSRTSNFKVTCDGHSLCECHSRTGVDCGSRTACVCHTVAVVDTVKLCTCDNVVTY